MYGTVTRFLNTPDLDTPLAALRPPSAGEAPRPGYLGRYAYRLPDDPDGLYLVRLFVSRAAYLAGAACATPGDWHDAGEIFTYRRGG